MPSYRHVSESAEVVRGCRQAHERVVDRKNIAAKPAVHAFDGLIDTVNIFTNDIINALLS